MPARRNKKDNDKQRKAMFANINNNKKKRKLPEKKRSTTHKEKPKKNLRKIKLLPSINIKEKEEPELDDKVNYNIKDKFREKIQQFKADHYREESEIKELSNRMAKGSTSTEEEL